MSFHGQGSGAVPRLARATEGGCVAREFATLVAMAFDPDDGVAATEATAPGFSERDFYLAEFRGRTLAVALPAAKPEELAATMAVLRELEANRTRVLVLSKDLSVLEALSGAEGIVRLDSGWVGRLWRAVRERGRVGILVEWDEELAEVCRRIALRLRLAKLVWIDPAGPLRRSDGERISLIDVAGLDELLAAGSATSRPRQLLAEIRSMVTQGLPAVNLCSFDGLADDLFTFEGSGTFFAREHYLEVRRLSLDEFDAAHALVQRGVAEGYLVERSPDQLDDVLANAFGVFVEDRYLAGVGALLVPQHTAGRELGSAATDPEDAAGEICSLYTLTRFLGEGVGGHLVDFALERATELRLEYVFACTTSDRVQAFFERQGFQTVPPAEIPTQKWRNYPPERRARVRCLRRDC